MVCNRGLNLKAQRSQLIPLREVYSLTIFFWKSCSFSWADAFPLVWLWKTESLEQYLKTF